MEMLAYGEGKGVACGGNLPAYYISWNIRPPERVVEIMTGEEGMFCATRALRDVSKSRCADSFTVLCAPSVLLCLLAFLDSSERSCLHREECRVRSSLLLACPRFSTFHSRSAITWPSSIVCASRRLVSVETSPGEVAAVFVRLLMTP